jgi:hypothetical protein
VCAYSLKESGITTPQDFIGKTVGLETAVNVDILYKIMMNKLGIDRSLVNEVTIGYDATELLEGTTDVSTGYIINEPNQAIEAGKEINTILMADYGVNMYADVIVATEDTIENRPELVEKFLRATLKGWQYALENADEAVDATLKYATDSSRSHQTYMLKSSVPLIHTGHTPIGWMEKSDWEQVQNILFEQGIIAKEHIRGIAIRVAKEANDYLESHPDMTVKDLQNDEAFQKIAVQSVGKTGYTAIVDYEALIIRFHAKPKYVDFDSHTYEKTLPEYWKIMAQVPGGKEVEGFYDWVEPDGSIKAKFMAFVPLSTRTSDDIGLTVAATTYLAEYNIPTEEKFENVENAYTTEFLEKIYNK